MYVAEHSQKQCSFSILIQIKNSQKGNIINRKNLDVSVGIKIGPKKDPFYHGVAN